MIRKLAEGDGPVAGGDMISIGFSRGHKKWHFKCHGVGGMLSCPRALLLGVSRGDIHPPSWELLHTLA